MNTPLMQPRSAVQALRRARTELMDTGRVPDGLVPVVLAQSWGRSLQFGLQPQGRSPGAPHASAAQLARALEHQRELVAHARPVMEFIFEQTRESDSMVVLADATGMLLHTQGDADFVERAGRVALRAGATWHEQYRGTNAIGTALAEQAAVVIHASEHFLERNGFLTCTAAPVHDPAGRLLGALDISGDHRGYHRHTLGLVRSGARMIEHQLFEARHGGHVRLCFHRQMEGLGALTAAQVALNDEGWIIGANAGALAALGLRREQIGRLPLEAVWPLDLGRLGLMAQCVRGPDGGDWWLRLHPGRHGARRLRVGAAVGSAAACGPRDALAALDLGDPVLRAALDKGRRVAGKPVALLLQGESGVGKEVFARALHASGPRRQGPFVAVNCAALPETLIEAELFGYGRGAFTGARREGAPGRILEAQGGTLLLDEVGDMPLALQARLLRVLQDRQVQPLGGAKPVPVDFALVCATHRDLNEEMRAGRFREDLFYRINGLSLQLPPLRERADQGALIDHLLHTLVQGPAPRLSAPVAQAFRAYRWPGNVRQLANVLRTACALLDEGESTIDWPHLPDDLLKALRPVADGAAGDAAEDPNLRRLSVRTIERVVAECEGNLSQAARELGISRNTLYRRRAAATAGKTP